MLRRPFLFRKNGAISGGHCGSGGLGGRHALKVIAEAAHGGTVGGSRVLVVGVVMLVVVVVVATTGRQVYQLLPYCHLILLRTNTMLKNFIKDLDK